MGRAGRALILALVAGGCSSSAPPANSIPSLVGTWRAAAYVSARAGEPPRYPFGQSPNAYLVYDATGHVFFQAIVDARLL
ncbi:MAG: hypothetical protein ACREBE_11880, partial [bacterium]